jgi:hypothetical protein
MVAVGITDDTRAGAVITVSIAQFGSTRSINAGVAAGIALHAWTRQHGDMRRAWWLHRVCADGVECALTAGIRRHIATLLIRCVASTP